jgi:hypothetical protein
MRGVVVKGFVVGELLGSGRSGLLYLARHPQTGRRAIVRFIRDEERSEVEVFHREAAALLPQTPHLAVEPEFLRARLDDGRVAHLLAMGAAPPSSSTTPDSASLFLEAPESPQAESPQAESPPQAESTAEENLRSYEATDDSGRPRTQSPQSPMQATHPLEPLPRLTGHLPPGLPTEDALAELRRDRRPLLVVATVGVLLLVGLGVAVTQPDGRVNFEATPLAQTQTTAPEAAGTQGEGVSAASPPVARPATAQGPPKGLAPPAEEAVKSTPLPPVPAKEAKVASTPPLEAPAPVRQNSPAKPNRATSRMPKCTFGPSFIEYARRERETLREVLEPWTPAVKRALQQVDDGLVSDDCQSVNIALERLRLAAGIQPE